MNNTYFFSMNNFSVFCDDKTYCANKNKGLMFVNLNQNVKISTNNSVSEFDYKHIDNSNHIKYAKIDGDYFVEIVCAPNEELLNKYTSPSCEIFAYKNHIDICYCSKIYSYYFCNDGTSVAIEQDDHLYVFNKKNVLEFDLKNKSFFLKKCKKYEKMNENVEILCEIPYTNAYFTLYNFNLNSKAVIKKNYKKGEIKIEKYSLPFMFFYLVKSDIAEKFNFTCEQLNYESVAGYLKQFNHIFEIDNKYYLSGSKICQISFVIENNRIVDID